LRLNRELQAKPWHRLAIFPAFPTPNWKRKDKNKSDCLEHQIYVLGHILYVQIELAVQIECGYSQLRYDNEIPVDRSIHCVLSSEMVGHSKRLISMEDCIEEMLIVVEV
jgi:hypothetical protein